MKYRRLPFIMSMSAPHLTIFFVVPLLILTMIMPRELELAGWPTIE